MMLFAAIIDIIYAISFSHYFICWLCQRLAATLYLRFRCRYTPFYYVADMPCHMTCRLRLCFIFVIAITLTLFFTLRHYFIIAYYYAIFASHFRAAIIFHYFSLLSFIIICWCCCHFIAIFIADAAAAIRLFHFLYYTPFRCYFRHISFHCHIIILLLLLRDAMLIHYVSLFAAIIFCRAITPFSPLYYDMPLYVIDWRWWCFFALRWLRWFTPLIAELPLPSCCWGHVVCCFLRQLSFLLRLRWCCFLSMPFSRRFRAIIDIFAPCHFHFIIISLFLFRHFLICASLLRASAYLHYFLSLFSVSLIITPLRRLRWWCHDADARYWCLMPPADFLPFSRCRFFISSITLSAFFLYAAISLRCCRFLMPLLIARRFDDAMPAKKH